MSIQHASTAWKLQTDAWAVEPELIDHVRSSWFDDRPICPEESFSSTRHWLYGKSRFSGSIGSIPKPFDVDCEPDHARESRGYEIFGASLPRN